MILIEFIILFVISLMFWLDKFIEIGYMKKFRIKQKYSSYNNEFQYHIEELWWLFWKKSKHPTLNRCFNSCKDADDALERWHLEQITNYVIIEKKL